MIDLSNANKDQIYSYQKEYYKSQSFLGDLLGFLDDIAKQRQRSINVSLFSQIIPQIVDIITVNYIPLIDPLTGNESKDNFKYPLNFTC